MEKLTCASAKKLDLMDFIVSLGYQPQKIKNNDYWFLSPLRTENTPSFKVDRTLNVWYDHAIGRGGDIIDFGTLYYKCSVSAFLKKLSQTIVPISSFQPHFSNDYGQIHQQTLAGEKKENPDSKIVIIDSRPLKDKSLLTYLDRRHISLAVAQSCCKEVDFLLYGKQHTVIGFQNNAGGYELRSANFKGSSSPKDITFLDKGASELTVFEGFFNFLSFQTLNNKQGQQLTNFLVLNSLSFFEKSRPVMEKHAEVNLYLDKDKAGVNATQQAMKWNKDIYKDKSNLYQGYKDLNNWLVNKQDGNGHKQKQGIRLRYFF